MGSSEATARRSPTKEVYDELQHAYDHFNRRLFGGELPTCVITLQRENPRTYGYFSSKRFGHVDGGTTDEIALNPTFFAVVPLVETMQTLVHEMCHLWQEHFGDPGRRKYHNGEWADKMESIGLIPSSTGQPGGKRTGERMADYPAAGGLFLQATEELLTQAFRLSWFDRFPHQRQVAMGNRPTVMDEHYVRLGGGVPAATGSVAANLEVVGATLTNADGSPAKPAPADRSNRVKYVCACRNQLWGRPGLRFRCEDCKELFEVTNGARAGPS